MSSNPKPPPSDLAKRNARRQRLLFFALLACVLGAVALLVVRRQSHALPTAAALAMGAAWQRLAAPMLSAPGASVVLPTDEELDFEPDNLPDQREALFKRMKRDLGVSDESLLAVRKVFEGSKPLGQGNPKITRHPMKRSECRKIRDQAGLANGMNPVCGAVSMVPLFDPGAGQTAQDARVCIDQFEFPNIACDYPVVFVRANEVADLCVAVGKRICDAHEWEGGCAGALKPPEQEYVWGPERIETSYKHNKTREIRWAYGPSKDHTKCGTGSFKNAKCHGSFSDCGSNTYPAGAFPACVSPLGVFDQHGNAAEHMNLPLKPDELASSGHYGSTEMKGSWFIFRSYEAHEDDCRWRAFDWHGTRITDRDSHRNYHLGFRCCKDVTAPGRDGGSAPSGSSVPPQP